MRRTHLALPLVALAACYTGGDAPPQPPGPTPPPVATVAVVVPTLAPPGGPTDAQREATLRTDPETLRDPFKRFRDDACPDCDTVGPTADALRKRNATVPFSDKPVQELSVRGTVAEAADGYAILADAQGNSQVVRVGAHIGKATVRGAEIVDWRVDRVRDGEVVLVEESTSTTAAPTTFVLHVSHVSRG